MEMSAWIPVIVAILINGPVFVGLIFQARKSKSDTLVSNAGAAAAFEKIARDAAQQIIDKSGRIQLLESMVLGLQSQVTSLQNDKAILQAEKDRQQAEQQLEIDKLEKRVKKLETLLSAHDIPFPKDMPE